LGNNILGSPASQDAGLQAEPVRLSFNSHDDALDYADELVEEGNHWLAIHELNVAQHYMRGDAEIRLCCSTGQQAEEFHFVFRPIPNRDFNPVALQR